MFDWADAVLHAWGTSFLPVEFNFHSVTVPKSNTIKIYIANIPKELQVWVQK